MTSRGGQDGSRRTREGGKRRPEPVRAVWAGSGWSGPVWTGLDGPGPVWVVWAGLVRSGPVRPVWTGSGPAGRSWRPGPVGLGPVWAGLGAGSGLVRLVWRVWVSLGWPGLAWLGQSRRPGLIKAGPGRRGLARAGPGGVGNESRGVGEEVDNVSDERGRGDGGLVGKISGRWNWASGGVGEIRK